MARKKYKIGVDIGGTKMLAVLLDGEKILDEYMLATPKDSVEHFVIMLNALLEPLLERAKKDRAIVVGIGIGIAGIIDLKIKKVLKSPNIPIIEGSSFVFQLEKKYILPVFIDNDANCFLRAEAKIGSARKYDNIFGITIGTGIGSAWWFNGNIYLGADGSAGEFGHNIIDFKSKLSLEKSYQDLTQRNTLNMSNEAYRGDPLAIRSFEEFGEILGLSLANLINTINPEIIVMGGGGSESADLFLPTSKKMIKEYAHSESGKKTKILISKLDKQAGAIGAAMLIE